MFHAQEQRISDCCRAFMENAGWSVLANGLANLLLLLGPWIQVQMALMELEPRRWGAERK